MKQINLSTIKSNCSTPHVNRPMPKRYRRYDGGKHCLSCGDSIPMEMRECASCTIIKMVREDELATLSHLV
jgi:hypothetical protein